MRVHPNPSHSDYVAYIKRDVLFPQITPQDIVQVTVEIDVAVDTITTTQADPIQVMQLVKLLRLDVITLLIKGTRPTVTVIYGLRPTVKGGHLCRFYHISKN